QLGQARHEQPGVVAVEVLAHALAQPPGLADVHDLALAVAHPVDAGLVGQQPDDLVELRTAADPRLPVGRDVRLLVGREPPWLPGHCGAGSAGGAGWFPGAGSAGASPSASSLMASASNSVAWVFHTGAFSGRRSLTVAQVSIPSSNSIPTMWMRSSSTLLGGRRAISS